MTRDDLFNTNASIVADLAAVCAKEAPNAQVLVIANPVNSTVPIVSEVYKKAGVKGYQQRCAAHFLKLASETSSPASIFGVTTLDVVRARTFVAGLKKLDPTKLKIPVIGGHAGITILPLLSAVHEAGFSNEELEALTKRIQFGGDEVVAAKAGTGSATLSMAYAGAEFATSVMRALQGEANVVECAFVGATKVVDGLSYFSSPIKLGKNGVESIPELGKLSAFEQAKLTALKPELAASIQKGIEFVAKRQ